MVLGLLAGQLRVEAVGGALGQAAVVGEDQCGVMAADVIQHARDDERPDGAVIAEVICSDNLQIEILR
jgi:hypothetical protein